MTNDALEYRVPNLADQPSACIELSIQPINQDSFEKLVTFFKSIADHTLPEAFNCTAAIRIAEKTFYAMELGKHLMESLKGRSNPDGHSIAVQGKPSGLAVGERTDASADLPKIVDWSDKRDPDVQKTKALSAEVTVASGRSGAECSAL